MVGFRFHLVSLVAVFLALGVGVIMGTTVLERPVFDILESRLQDLENDLDAARDDISSLRADRAELRAFTEAISPWAVRGRLTGAETVMVVVERTPDWAGEVDDVLTQAGATAAGILTVTDKWALRDEGAREQLVLIMQSSVPDFDPGAEPAEAALTALGTALPSAAGRTLAGELTRAGFLVRNAPGNPDVWPPERAAFVALAGSVEPDDPRASWLAAIARGVGSAAPTVVVGQSPDAHSGVTILRGDADWPVRMATFDSGAADTTGAGTVLALRAAIDQRGGHFGRAADLRFLPEPPATTPEPTSTPPR